MTEGELLKAAYWKELYDCAKENRKFDWQRVAMVILTKIYNTPQGTGS